MVIEGPDRGARHPLSGRATTIGREMSNDITLTDEQVSRQHAKIISMKGSFFIQDLGSSNGTYVNGEKEEEAILETGDVLLLGQTELVFRKE